MEQDNGHDSLSRIERLEKIVEVLANVQADMQQDHQMLLRAQIVMTDELAKLAVSMAGSMSKLDARMELLAASQQRTDDALSALMGTVDEIIRSGGK